MQEMSERWFWIWVGQISWRRAWKPNPAFLLGESHGQRSLAGYSPWDHKESDRTEVTQHACITYINWLNVIQNKYPDILEINVIDVLASNKGHSRTIFQTIFWVIFIIAIVCTWFLYTEFTFSLHIYLIHTGLGQYIQEVLLIKTHTVFVGNEKS